MKERNIRAITYWHEEISGGIVKHSLLVDDIVARFPGVVVEHVIAKSDQLVNYKEAQYMMKHYAFKLCILPQSQWFIGISI